MQIKHSASEKIAESLLDIQAVKLSPENPFTWASGWKSPIYCDNRQTLSYPKVRDLIRNEFVNNIRENFETPDVIAGVATGGIALGALVAQELNLPFVYVRSSSKGHGLQNQVEGNLKKGQKVVVIEDLVSTGKSSLNAVAALREAEAEVIGMCAIFTYGFQVATDNFREANCPLITLSDYQKLVKLAVDKNYISADVAESLQKWRTNPSKWGIEHAN